MVSTIAAFFYKVAGYLLSIHIVAVEYDMFIFSIASITKLRSLLNLPCGNYLLVSIEEVVWRVVFVVLSSRGECAIRLQHIAFFFHPVVYGVALNKAACVHDLQYAFDIVELLLLLLLCA